MENEDIERVKQASRSLGEYWDSVLILCSRDSEDGDGATEHVAQGYGNVFARIQQAREYVIHHDEITRILSREQHEGEKEI